MRRIFIIVAICALTGWLPACGNDAGETPRPEVLLSTIPGQFSYAIGQDSVKLLEQMESVTFDGDAFLLGIEDALEGKTSRLSEADMVLVKNIVAKKERDLRNENIKRLTQKNKEDQEAFLSRNRGVEGVLTTASGLQYKIIQPGSGPSPELADVVQVRMKVSLPDGSIIDSTDHRGGPVLIKVQDNLPGYQEALLLMNQDATCRFWVPYQLAYGEEGNFADGGKVGPCQMLILDITLLEIVDRVAASDGSAD